MLTTAHRVLAPADYRAMPWRNGGGTTHEIATGPDGADLASFAWRVSIADVARDGPFSAFAGVDRTLVLLAGAGMRLTADGQHVVLQSAYEPLAFAGEVPFACTLIDGPTRDFNLMVRRALAQGALHVVRDAPCRLPRARTYVCFAATGTVVCTPDGQPALVLAPECTAVIDASVSRRGLHVAPASAGAVALVAAIDRVDGAV
jgi:uncharacterized protein